MGVRKILRLDMVVMPELKCDSNVNQVESLVLLDDLSRE